MKKKYMSLAMVFMFCSAAMITFAACGTPAEPKTFESGNGLSITLTTEFTQNTNSQFALEASSNTAFFAATKDEFSIFPQLDLDPDMMTLDDYAQLCITANGLQSTVNHNTELGITYFVYDKTIQNNHFFYYATVQKGTDAFWLNQFGCFYSARNNMTSKFETWASSIIVQ